MRDDGGRVVKNCSKLCDVIYGRPHSKTTNSKSKITTYAYKKYGSFKKIIAVKPKLQILRAACIYYVLKALTVKFYKLNFIFLLT